MWWMLLFQLQHHDRDFSCDSQMWEVKSVKSVISILSVFKAPEWEKHLWYSVALLLISNFKLNRYNTAYMTDVLTNNSVSLYPSDLTWENRWMCWKQHTDTRWSPALYQQKCMLLESFERCHNIKIVHCNLLRKTGISGFGVPSF